MTKLPEQLFPSARTERLSDAEKANGRLQLQKFMGKTPVRAPSFMRQLWYGGFTPSLSLTLSKSMIVALIVAVSVALGGGVSFAAEQTMPGDALYVVKTNVNEPLRSALTLSSEGKAEWKARLVERRLEEAETLAIDGKLSDELREAIALQLEEHVGDVKSAIEDLRSGKGAESAAEVGARFEVALRVHEDILAKLVAKADGPAESLRAEVKKHHDDSKKLEDDLDEEERADDEDDDEDDKREAAEGKLKAAENKIAEVRAFVEKAKVTDATRVAANAKLTAIDALIVSGKAQMTAETYQQAFDTFKKAHREAQDVKVSVAAEQTLSARVQVSLDTDEDEDGDRKDEDREEKRREHDEDEDDDEDDNEDEDNEDDDDRDDDRDRDRGILNIRSGFDLHMRG